MNFGDNRLGRNPVKLIGINTPFEPSLQFGREYHSSNSVRENTHASWGRPQMGRIPEPTAIKSPLPAREQSIMAHQLSPQLQQQLRGGIRPIENKPRSAFASVKPQELDSVHTGAALATSSRIHTTLSPSPDMSGNMRLRTVMGDYNFQA